MRIASVAADATSPVWMAATRPSPSAMTASLTSWAPSAWAATCAASSAPPAPSASRNASPNTRTNKTDRNLGKRLKNGEICSNFWTLLLKVNKPSV